MRVNEGVIISVHVSVVGGPNCECGELPSPRTGSVYSALAPTSS